MERTTKPDVQSIEDGITLLAMETTCAQNLDQLWNDKG